MRITSFLLCILFLISCRNASDHRNGTVASASETFGESDIINYLDYYCGYPGDPNLPKGILGATDDVLAGRDDTELYDLMESALPIAKDKLRDTPRLLFEVGRAAYRLGYHDQAESWIGQAADAGSVGAKAWLGVYNYDLGNKDDAIKFLEKAKSDGYQARWLETLLAPVPSEKTTSAINNFRRPDIIQALWDRNFPKVKSLQSSGAHYYLKSLNEVLTNTEILFLVDAPDILLDTRPEITTLLETDQAIFSGLGLDVLGTLNARLNQSNTAALAVAASNAHGKQDGYRLALLYQRDYESFQKIYAGITDYVLNHLNE